MPATVILNPYSNRWEAQKKRPEIEAALKAAGVDYVIQLTESPHHATKLARQAVEMGNTPVIAAGGDGLYDEVVNGLMQAGYNGPMGLIPVGTCNDLTDMLGIPRDLNEVAKVIAAGHTRQIDLGRVNDHYFDNNSAVGLEAAVGIRHASLTRVRGAFRYILAALIEIFKNPTWDVIMEWEGGRYEGEVLLVSVGNTSRTGCVYFMTPQAQPDSGKLDFVFAKGPLPFFRIIQLMRLVFKGEHIHEPEVQMYRSSFLKITLKEDTAIQADGEIIATNVREVYYEVAPKAISVFAPAS